ncbi:MAG: helix-turn-helix domain-containing protein [Lachnospiraceae bacterium]|nr:helix-turn-helix domain-containing protein [Lachnospiraceae bacterium]
MTLEEQIKHYRKQAGLSQEKMAEKIGVSRQAITKWENGTGAPDIANLMAIAELFQISVDELLSNEKPEKKQADYIYESCTEYDIDGKKNFDIKLGGAYIVELKAYEGEKIVVSLLSNIYKNLQADYKVKIDDIKNRIDVDLNRLNGASETDAKESLVVEILLPAKYVGKIELSVNAGTINIIDIENEIIEIDGKIKEVFLQGNKSEIEIDSNLDMQIKVASHEGALEINQLSATSKLTVPEGYSFRSAKKGIATHIYYEKQGKKVEDFSNDEADNYIELNGMKSELVIEVAEV